MTEQELIEQLADKEHASWARWMQYLFSKCIRQYDGSFVIRRELAERWQRQVEMPYAELTEQEKQSDRDEVAHILPIIDEHMKQSALLDKEKLTYRVHNLEHLVKDFIDFVEKPQIAGDGFAALAAYSEALCKHARIVLERNE